VGEGAEAEDPVAGLDIGQRLARPEGGPRAHHLVAELLEGRVVAEVSLGQQRVEALVARDPDQPVEHGEIVLAVSVDGAHQIIGA